MAKRVVDEDIRFSLIINGDKAQKELHEVEASTRKLTATNKNLRKERDKLRAQGKQNTAEYKRLSKTIKENNATLKNNKARMKELQSQIGITGLTMAQLQKRASSLRLQLRNMVPGSAQYKKLQAELTATNSRIKQLATQANAAKLSLSGLANGFNKYAALGASVIATGTGLALSMSKLIDYSGELSDAQADVMKTTGLTKDEVEGLTKQLGEIDTRSSRMELLGLAEEAGRLGINGVENVKGFVATADQLKVALGDELSDTAIREVGKMANIFNVGEQTGRNFEESMQSLGSAINEVSASGANTADFLVDFMKRTAGVANVADINADKIVGMAAAFDELGQSREISATAINKTLLSMGKDVDKFANIAGQSVGEFSKLLEEDANEALIKFLEGLDKGNPTMEEMAKRLDGIEVGGTRGVQAIAALAGNTELLRKRQENANDALEENTSLYDEFVLKNENAAAILAKIRRRLVGIFASDTITGGISDFLNWFAKFIGATEDADGSVTRFRDRLMFFLKALSVVVVGIFSYNAATAISAAVTGTAHSQTLLYTAALKAKNLVTGAATALTRTYAISKGLLTGKIKLATAAQKLFNIAVRNNPIGLIVALLAAAATAYIAFSKSVSEAERRQNMLNDVRLEAAKSIAKEKNELERLLEVARDETLSKEERENAINRLNEISPEYLGNLTLENVKTKEGIALVEDYVEALNKKALAQAAENKQVELQQKLIETQMKNTDEYKSKLDNLGDNTIGKLFDKVFGETEKLNIRTREELDKYLSQFDYSEDLENALRKNYEPLFEAKEAEIAEIEKDIESLNEFMKKGIEGGDIEIDAKADPVEDDFSYTPTSPTENPTDDKTNFRLKNLMREREAVRQIRKENFDLEAQQIDDAFEKEMQLLESNHKDKLAKLQAQKVQEAEITETQNLLDKAVVEGNQEAIDNYTQVLEIWKEKNAEIDRQILLQKEAHQDEVGKVIQNAIEEDIQLMENAFANQQQLLQEQRNQELAAVADSERKTKQLKEQYRQEDLDREKKHVKQIQTMLTDILDSGTYEDFNLELLTAEQKDAIVARLKELGLEISEINLLLAQMQNGGGKQEALDDLGLGGQTDILGFTPEQWDNMFLNFEKMENVMESVLMSTMAAQEAYAMYADFQMKKENERIKQFEANNQKEKNKLQEKLDAGYINQRQYNTAVESLDRKLEKEKEEIAKKQAKREKIMALASIATNTANAIMSIWAQVPKFDFGVSAGLLTGMVTALGAAQAAAVLTTKGYEDGFYGDRFPVRREQDGKIFDASYGGMSRSGIVDEPTMFLAGERGKEQPEMIISGGDYAQLTPDLKDTLNRQLGSVRGYEDGLYRENVPSETSEETKILLSQNVEILNALYSELEKGIIAKVIANEANAREMQEALDNYKKRKESSKL